MDTEAGTLRTMLPFRALPGEQSLVMLDQKTLREVLSSDVRADLGRTVMNFSGVGTRYHSELDNSEESVDVRATGNGTVSEEANTTVSSGAEVLGSEQA